MDLMLPNFKYYELNRDLVVRDGDTIKPIGPIPAWRAENQNILRAAMTLLKNSEHESKQRWINAMLWSWFNWLPDYFFQAPTSSTRKYHPAWANQPNGLLLHSLAVCRVAASLSDLLDIPPKDYNGLIFAAWHHDMFKYGELDEYRDGELTIHEHPVIAGDFFRLETVQKIMGGFGIHAPECEKIADLIMTHDGPYRYSFFSSVTLPECTGQLNKLLYKADYIASRKEDGWVEDILG